MPRKDLYHECVRTALENEGWAITHDPYTIKMGSRKGYIDLGAEKLLIGAEKENEKIAVEVKTFSGYSDLDQFEDALGQFLVYLFALSKTENDRVLFLAIPIAFYSRFFKDTFFVELCTEYQVRMIIFDENTTDIIQWIK